MASNCNCKDEFCDDYVVMKPKEASLLDLFYLLFSSDLEKRNFVDSHPERPRKVANLQRRWIIFLTILMQKILLLIAEPMAWVGSVSEEWLNLVSCNGGFTKLLFNFISGTKYPLWIQSSRQLLRPKRRDSLFTIGEGKLGHVVPPPNKSSATFSSYIGKLDTRLDLDKSIKPDDDKYYKALSMMASKISYENEAFAQNVVTNHWKMEFTGFYNFWNDFEQTVTTQAFIFQDRKTNPEMIMVAFRGTEPFNAYDWISDVDLSWYKLPGVGKVHGGFMKALGLQKKQGWPKEVPKEKSNHPFAYYSIREMLRDMLQKNEQAKFFVTGHSLGGALAILFPLVLFLHEETWLLERLEGVYTFGQPRVGDHKLGEYMNKQLKAHSVKYIRFVYCNDIVPRLPLDDSTFMFKHFGPCVYFNSLYESKMVKEEPNKNYFAILEDIPKHLNAMWELIRGYLIPLVKGTDYAEGWCETMFRVLGLVIPGISDHGPQDYVNSTRLCSLIPSLQLEDLTHQEGLD